MQLLRADADFGAKAEFKAIGEARRRVDVDSGRIDGGLEGSRCGLVSVMMASEWWVLKRRICSSAS